VIVISGQEDEHTIARARALGVEDYLVKSHFKTSLLLELVRKHLERPRTPEPASPLGILPTGDAPKAGVGS
jgi:PleD family two-component response regulator